LLPLDFVVLSESFGRFLRLGLFVHILGITFVAFHIAGQGNLGGKLGDRRLLYQ